MSAEVVSVTVAKPSAPYGHAFGAARRFVDDAAAHVRAIAGAVGATLQELAGPSATVGAVAAAIRAAAARLYDAPAGLFVLAFAGHGGRLRDRDGDEPDGLDEAWALDDAPLTDDMLAALLGELHADVHVVLISNCCFAAGVADAVRVASAARAADGPPPVRAWPMGSSDALAVPAALAGEPDTTNRVLIAACEDDRTIILPDSSRLTRRVLDAVFPVQGDVRQRQPVDYAAVEASVRGLASVSQTPVLVATDRDKQRPAFVPQPLRAR